jgi:predicted secreted protein
MMGETIVIAVGDGATPTELFVAPTLINTTRSIEFSTSVEEDDIVDLNNQSAPAQKVRRIKSTDFKIDGAGMIHQPDVFTWLSWSKSGAIKNVKVTSPKFTITGPFVLSTFQITGDRLKSSECQITLQQAGAVTLVEVTS